VSVAAPTIQEQADFLYALARRCIMRDGSVAGETLLSLERRDVEMLEGLRARLERMAPHEERIRAVVTGRRG
jgi:hypothetical protein